MLYETIIALRYLGSRKKNHFISVISVISCAGVGIGVWALIVVLSVMTGFEGDLRKKILETYAHLLVDRPKGNLSGYTKLLPGLDGLEGLDGVSPFLRTEVMISSITNLSGVTLKGIHTARARGVNHLDSTMVEGELAFIDHPEAIPRPGFPSWAPRAGGVEEAGSPASPKEEAGSPASPKEEAGSPASPKDEEPPGDPAGPSPDAERSSMRMRGGGGEAERGTSEESVRSSTSTSTSTSTEGDFVRRPAFPGVVASTANPAPHLGPGSLMPRLILPGPEEPRRLPGVVIGSELKKNLLVLIGDEVTILSPLGDLSPAGPIPRSRTFRVAGAFFTGMYEYDSKMVYVTLPEAQAFLGLGDEVSGIELQASDPDATGGLVKKIGAMLHGQGLRIRDWKTLNANLFAALLLEKVAMFVILTLVTIVASFNIVASLIMVVLEKKKEVAILKALGSSDQGIRRIFMTEGLLIGTIGTLFGLLAGVATCWAIGRFGIPLDREVYYIDRLPVEMHALDIAIIGASAVVISFLATIYPARLAARLLPAEGLRHE